MKLLGSRTILQLDFFGYVAVALPLMAALVTALIEVDNLVTESRRAIFRSAQTVNASRLLMEHATDMARNAQQFLVLGDEELYELYNDKRMEFRDTLDELTTFKVDEAHHKLLERIGALEQKVFEALEGHRRGERGEPPEKDFAELTNLARVMLLEGSRLMERRANQVRAAAAELERKLTLMALGVLPIAFGLGAMFTFLIAKPLRQMDHGIRRLGRGEFGSTIEVSGARDLEELGQRLDWLRQRLVALEQQKVNFLRQVSHELKTPLATIREGAELMRDGVAGTLSPQQAEIAQILNDSSIRLQSLIEDLLRFNVEHSEEPSVNARHIELDKLAQEVIADQKVSFSAKRVRVNKELEHVEVSGHPEQLRVVLENLVSNGVKYSPRGGRIFIALQKRDGVAVLDVRDEGPGIRGEERERIFEAFYQGHGSPDAPLKGTGLGLAIAREYVRLHHGNIEVVESARGAHLRVTLPVDADQAARA